MKRRIVLPFFAILTACGVAASAFGQTRVTEHWSYEYFGLQVSVPPNIKGRTKTSTEGVIWYFSNVTFAALVQPDTTFQLYRDDELIGTAKPGDRIEFTEDLHLIHHPKKTK